MELSLLNQVSEADVLFILSGVAGMAFHYVKKVAKKQTEATFFGWFGRDNLPATFSTLGAFAMACLTALGTGIVTADMTFWQLLYLGITTGYAVDSGFNSDGKRRRKKIDT